MMKITFLLLGLPLFFNTYAFEMKEKIKCVGNDCQKETTITGFKQRPLRFDEYETQKCLVEMKSNQEPTFYYVLEKDSSKITLLKENEYKNNIAIYNRVFFWKKDFDSMYLKKIPCDQTTSFFDNVQLQKCVSGKRGVSKYYCDLKNNETNY